jgi:hypothetical protein
MAGLDDPAGYNCFCFLHARTRLFFCSVTTTSSAVSQRAGREREVRQGKAKTDVLPRRRGLDSQNVANVRPLSRRNGPPSLRSEARPSRILIN